MRKRKASRLAHIGGQGQRGSHLDDKMSAPTWSHAAAIAAEQAFAEVPARRLKKTLVQASKDPERAAQLLQRVGVRANTSRLPMTFP